MFYVLYQTELRCCEGFCIKTHRSTGGIRTRDLGINSAVIPTAFTADGQNFLLSKLLFKSFQKCD
jgi:hypothetical protein